MPPNYFVSRVNAGVNAGKGFKRERGKEAPVKLPCRSVLKVARAHATLASLPKRIGGGVVHCCEKMSRAVRLFLWPKRPRTVTGEVAAGAIESSGSASFVQLRRGTKRILEWSSFDRKRDLKLNGT